MLVLSRPARNNFFSVVLERDSNGSLDLDLEKSDQEFAMIKAGVGDVRAVLPEAITPSLLAPVLIGHLLAFFLLPFFSVFWLVLVDVNCVSGARSFARIRLEDWNRTNPSNAVKVFDRIIAVNRKRAPGSWVAKMFDLFCVYRLPETDESRGRGLKTK